MRLPVIIASTVLTVSFAGMGLAFADADSDDADQVVDHYLDASKVQQEALRGVQMDVDIDAQLPKLKQKGKLKLLRIVSRVGKITYKKLGEFVGDPTVKNEVIERYLAAEQEGRENGSMAITRANYKFKLKRKFMQPDQLTQADQKVYVFELTPKKKKLGLFKGELWLDGCHRNASARVGRTGEEPLPFPEEGRVCAGTTKSRTASRFPCTLKARWIRAWWARAELTLISATTPIRTRTRPATRRRHPKIQPST